jgi:hypothetical protein
MEELLASCSPEEINKADIQPVFTIPTYSSNQQHLSSSTSHPQAPTYDKTTRPFPHISSPIPTHWQE